MDRSLGGPSTAAAGAPDKAGRSQADSGMGLGVAAILAQGSTRRQQQSDTVPSSARTTPLTAGAAAAAAAAVGKRRARSHSPVRHQAAAGAAANLADELSRLLQLEQGAACHTTGERADSPGAAATLQRLDSSGAGAGLQAAAAAVVSQLKALGAQQGECPCKPSGPQCVFQGILLCLPLTPVNCRCGPCMGSKQAERLPLAAQHTVCRRCRQ